METTNKQVGEKRGIPIFLKDTGSGFFQIIMKERIMKAINLRYDYDFSEDKWLNWDMQEIFDNGNIRFLPERGKQVFGLPKCNGMKIDNSTIRNIMNIIRPQIERKLNERIEEIEKSKKEGLKFKITKCNSMIADMGSTEYYPVLKNENMKELFSEELEKIKPYIKNNIYYEIVENGVWKIEGKEYKEGEEVSGKEILELVSKKIEEKESKIQEEEQKKNKILSEMEIIEIDSQNEKQCDSYHVKKSKIKYKEIIYIIEDGWMDNSFGEGSAEDNMIPIHSINPKPKIQEKYFFQKIGGVVY